MVSFWIRSFLGNLPHPDDIEEIPEVGKWHHDDSDMMENPLTDPNYEGMEKYVQLQLLMAMVIIKLRMAAFYEQCCEQRDLFFNDANINKKPWFEQFKSRIVDKLDSMDDKRLSVQGDHAMGLLKIVEKRNRILVCALVNPNPLIAQGPPRFLSPGTAEEAASVIEVAYRQVYRIPGAVKKIEKFLGSDRSYDPRYGRGF